MLFSRFQSVEYRCELPYSETKPIAVSLIEEPNPVVKVGESFNHLNAIVFSNGITRWEGNGFGVVIEMDEHKISLISNEKLFSFHSAKNNFERKNVFYEYLYSKLGFNQ